MYLDDQGIPIFPRKILNVAEAQKVVAATRNPPPPESKKKSAKLAAADQNSDEQPQAAPTKKGKGKGKAATNNNNIKPLDPNLVNLVTDDVQNNNGEQQMSPERDEEMKDVGAAAPPMAPPKADVIQPAAAPTGERILVKKPESMASFAQSISVKPEGESVPETGKKKKSRKSKEAKEGKDEKSEGKKYKKKKDESGKEKKEGKEKKKEKEKEASKSWKVKIPLPPNLATTGPTKTQLQDANDIIKVFCMSLVN